ncbi:MAG: hypothetical protein ACYC66_02530 [Chloroflexota bacterium]
MAAKKPDLLCVEVATEDWEARDLDRAPIEGREVLARLSLSSEITLVPMGAGGRLWAEDGIAYPCRGLLVSFRRGLFRLLDGMTIGLMKLAGGPRAINSGFVEHLCGAMCYLQVVLADREARRAWIARNQGLLDRVLWIVRHDPGRRLLVTVDCRRKHWLRGRLRSVPEVALVDFWRF